MASRLIDKVTKMVTVDYFRLTFVENPDGFLLDDEVCSLLRQEKNIEVIVNYPRAKDSWACKSPS